LEENYKVKGIREMMDIEASKVQLGYLEPNRRYVSSFVDNVFSKIALQRRMAIPQMDRWQHRDPETLLAKGAGGYVPEPEIGLHFNIVSIDYFSLYPTIYMTHNNGINTVDWDREDEEAILSDELQFNNHPKALNAEFMEYLIGTRGEYRKERDKYEKGTDEYNDLDVKQNAFKSILVSANGVLEEKKFRYKNQAIYNSTTKTGQSYLKLLIEACESLGWELIGGDTDGAHFKTPYDTIEEIVEALPMAEEIIQNYVRTEAQARWNIPDELYAILPRCEQISSHFFYIAKKSYVRRIVWEDGKYLSKPRFDAKGMPGVKYNTLPLLKEILKNVFKEVIFNVERGTDYVPLVVDYLLKCRDDLFSGRRDDWLTFAQRVDKLDGRLPHNRAGKILAERGLFVPGMIISFIRRANGSLILPDYEEEVEVDRRTYNYWWQGATASWMKRLLPEVAGDRSLGFREASQTKKLDW
jgi:DNA polymerase I